MTKTARTQKTNHFFKIALFFSLATTQIDSSCQQLVQNPKDLLLVCAQDEHFIGKPLKVLFDEFKPAIKLVFPEGGHQERLAHFTFFFSTKKVFDKYRRQHEFPIHITVFLKETFNWTWEGRDRSLEHYLDWLKEDEEKYSNLTIVGIRVNGEYDPCDEELGTNL